MKKALFIIGILFTISYVIHEVYMYYYNLPENRCYRYLQVNPNGICD